MEGGIVPVTAGRARSARGGRGERPSTRGDGREGKGSVWMAVFSDCFRMRWIWSAVVLASNYFRG